MGRILDLEILKSLISIDRACVKLLLKKKEILSVKLLLFVIGEAKK